MNTQVVNIDLSVNFHVLILSHTVPSLLLEFLCMVIPNDVHQKVWPTGTERDPVFIFSSRIDSTVAVITNPASHITTVPK